MMKRCSLMMLLLAACPAPPPRQEPPRPPPPTQTVVEYEVHGEMGGGIPTLDQPPHVKRKVGHFRNDQFNIGVTIDLLSAATESVADLDPALVRFDGDAKLWRLEARHGGGDRIDYVRSGDRVMLQVERGGHMRIFIVDPETDRAGEPIELYRDADAEPLSANTQPKGNP